MPTDLILKASSIITMEDAQPRAEAIAIDTATGDSPVVQAAQIPLGPGGESMMNYNRLAQHTSLVSGRFSDSLYKTYEQYVN